MGVEVSNRCKTSLYCFVVTTRATLNTYAIVVFNQTNRPAVHDTKQWTWPSGLYLREQVDTKLPTGSEREHCGVLAGAEHVHDGLTHEEANGDTNGDCNHSSSNVDRRSIRCNASRLGEAGLHRRTSSLRTIQNKPEGQTLTGTKNRTPVTMDVNAVPPIFLE